MPSKVLEILETEIGLRLGKFYISPYPSSDGCPHPHTRINCGLSARRKTASCDCDCTDCRCCRCRSVSLGQPALFHLVQHAFRRLHEGGKLGLRDVPVLVLVG